MTQHLIPRWRHDRIYIILAPLGKVYGETLPKKGSKDVGSNHLPGAQEIY